MKTFTYVLFALTVVAVVGTLWVFRPTAPMVETIATSVPGDAKKSPDRSRAAVVSGMSRTEVIEPILVLPEIEVAPAPALHPSTYPEIAFRDMNKRFSEAPKIDPAVLVDTARIPRPEVGREQRPWMPYAPEDRELADTRRLEWVKLSVRDAEAVPRPSDFEETQEPPLLEPQE